MKKNQSDVFSYRKDIIKTLRIISLACFFMLVGFLQVKAEINSKSDRSTRRKSMPEAGIKQQQQTRTVTGKITDTNGEPVIGASVSVKGTTIGSNTDVNGNFSLNVPGNSNTLVVTYIGMKLQELNITGKSNVTVVMEAETTQLEEVVITGYAKQKKISVTGAIVSVQSADLMKSPAASVSNTLTGRVTGVSTVQSIGQPGVDAPNIFVRGVGTLSASASTPLILVDGVERSFTQIDPNEIESVSVLKDASSTAVYGIRGANGVLIVTTKRGFEGAPKISITTSAGFQAPSNIPEYSNSYDYAVAHNNANLSDNPAALVNFSPLAVKSFADGRFPELFFNKDFMNDIVKPTALQTQSNINISGGSSVVKYFVSLGSLFQDGQLNSFGDEKNFNYGYNRYNYRGNLDVDITKSTRLSTSIGGIYGIVQAPAGSGSGWSQLYRACPWEGQLLDGKHIALNNRYITTSSRVDPYGAIGYKTGYKRDYSNTINLDLGLTQKLDFIAKGLNWRVKLANNSISTQNKTRSTSHATYDPWFLCDIWPGENVGDSTIVYKKYGADGVLGYSESSGKSRNWYMETALAYENSFGEHYISGLLLYNQSKSFYPSQYSDIPMGYVGIAGRVTYDYKHKYLAEVNIGYNGSENFAPGNRFGFFPAIAVGWTVSEENFMKNSLAFINFMKIRYSYGVVGNDKIGSDRFLYTPDSYTLNATGYSFGTDIATLTPGASESKIGNPNVTWERSKKQNLGIDLRFIKGKLTFTTDLFYEFRDNILTRRQTVPELIGFQLPALNLGKVENKGFETEIRWRSNVGKFNYDIGGNVSFARNKIIEMDEIPQPYPWLVQTGRSVGTRWAYNCVGFWTADEAARYTEFPDQKFIPKAGDARFEDINGDNLIDSYDVIPTGFPDYPEIVFSMSGGAEFKGFDLSFLFSGASNCTRVFEDTWRVPFQGIGSWGLVKYLNDNAWTPETAETAIFPRTTFASKNNNYATSQIYMQDASYIRLKTLEIGYSFSLGIMKRLGISKIRVFTNGYNLLTFTRLDQIDPESNTKQETNMYPLIKIVNFGLNVNF